MSRIHYAWAALFCLLAAAGCLASPAEEAEHHLAAHMPRDFPAAARRLTHLHQTLLEGSRAQSKELRTPNEKTAQIEPFAEMCDVTRWLPELAADSDLPEEPWERVYNSAANLESLLLPLAALNVKEQRDAYHRQADRIAKCIDQITGVANDYSADPRQTEDDPS